MPAHAWVSVSPFTKHGSRDLTIKGAAARHRRLARLAPCSRPSLGREPEAVLNEGLSNAYLPASWSSFCDRPPGLRKEKVNDDREAIDADKHGATR